MAGKECQILLAKLPMWGVPKVARNLIADRLA